MIRSGCLWAAMLTLLVSSELAAAEVEFPKFKPQEIENGLGVGYAVLLEDVNHDKKTDIVIVDTKRVVWYENPTWKQHHIIRGGTQADNVCIQSEDVDGDGKVDFILGAGWRPFNTKSGGTLQWLKRGKSLDQEWNIHPIGTEPMIHRIRMADVDGDGRNEVVSAPLMGRNSTRQKNFMDGLPVRITAYKIPKKPASERWQPTVLDESMHVVHNIWPVPAKRKKGADILAVSYEGVFRLTKKDGKWVKEKIGKGDQSDRLGRFGASEIKLGKLKSGKPFIATIEPWHGDRVVVYTQPSKPGEMWNRHVIDKDLYWGHAVWCADLDGDGGDELIIGVRDDMKSKDTPVWRRGVRIYKPLDKAGTRWQRKVIEHGGVAVEDLAAGDLDGDGRIDLVAVGRQTHNARIYWNKGKK